MLIVESVEQRTNMVKGKAPVTVRRAITFRNGKGTKTVEVLKGEKIVSTVTEPFTIAECENVQNRKFTKGLFKSAEKKTRKKMQKKRK